MKYHDRPIGFETNVSRLDMYSKIKRMKRSAHLNLK